MGLDLKALDVAIGEARLNLLVVTKESCKKIVCERVEYKFDAQEVTYTKIHVF